MSARTVSIAEAEARLSELIASGDEIVGTKRGVPVGTLQPLPAPRKQVDLAWLREITKDMAMSPDSMTVIRQMRDEARY